ncbi:MAG: DUF2946 domain-containing protein [Pseudomonadota bacterium]
MAILFSALAPSISHALSAVRADVNQVEICTVDGTRTISVGAADGKQVPKDSVQHHFEHCPYCMTHAASFALLPSTAMTFAVLGGHDLFPSLFYNAPTPLFSWSAANPRAPPASA